VTLTLGPSIVEQAGRRRTRLIGGVGLDHPFGRSWSMRASYRRGLTFLEGAAQPFLSHSGALELDGLLTRRLEVSVSLGAVLGDIGLDSTASATGYDTYSAATRMRYALNSRFALYGEYLYNRSLYSLDNGLPGIDRSGVRVGINAYLPLMSEPAPRRGR